MISSLLLIFLTMMTIIWIFRNMDIANIETVSTYAFLWFILLKTCQCHMHQWILVIVSLKKYFTLIIIWYLFIHHRRIPFFGYCLIYSLYKVKVTTCNYIIIQGCVLRKFFVVSVSWFVIQICIWHWNIQFFIYLLLYFIYVDWKWQYVIEIIESPV